MVRRVRLGYLNIPPTAEHRILDAIRSNRLSAGRHTADFEAAFAKAHQCVGAVFLNSGTSALHTSLLAAKELHRYAADVEVILPATTFIATLNAVIIAGLKPVLVDVDADTFNIDVNAIQRAITTKTKVIIPVHLFGMPADLHTINSIAAAHRLDIIEDSCECMFASQFDQSVGSAGLAGCFSTYVAHLMTTGVGGLITSTDADFLKLCRSIMAHGRDCAYLNIDDDEHLVGPALDYVVDRRFSFVRLGHSFRLTELEAAIGLSALDNIEINLARRDRLSTLYYSLLSGIDQLSLQHRPPSTIYHHMLFPIVIKDDSRNGLAHKLERAGVETRQLMPLTNQPHCIRQFGCTDADLPVAAYLNHHGLCLPCHDGMVDDDVHYIAGIIDEHFKRQS